MNNDLMMAILAMDAYNQGYDRGTLGVGTAIGDTNLAFDSTSEFSPSTAAAGQAAGFFAAAYTLADGSKVISYRGTDKNAAALLALAVVTCPST